MDCETDPSIFTQFGWDCDTTLTGLQDNDKFYVRCQDISEKKNTMTESYIYELRSSNSELVIEEIRPEKGYSMTSSVEPVSVKLRMRTSGGAEGGEAVCRWEENRARGFGDSFRYEDSEGSNVHEYALTFLGRGKYDLNFFCEDVAGNTAENSTNFEIKIDKYGPRIVRIYYEGGIKIVTSEKAKCRYSFNRNENFENATVMYGSNREHYGGWEERINYIQCEDEYGNKGSKVMVRPVG